MKIGDYCYHDNPIGWGSFSKVYKGVHIETNQKVAIKRIHVQKLNKQLHLRLDIEIKIMKSLDHPNIIKFYDVLYSDNKEYIFIILEYCENGDFSKLVNSHKTENENKIKYYMKQLRDGLEYLRNNNIVHRDLKPKNILITNNMDVLKIADFGFAKNVVDDCSLMDTLCGSPLYMAPEILNKKQYNISSDLWSVGVILYEMVYHKYPYGNPLNILDLMHKIESCKIEFPEISISIECMNLLKLLLQVDNNYRITWTEFFNHEWFKMSDITVTPINLNLEDIINPYTNLNLNLNLIKSENSLIFEMDFNDELKESNNNESDESIIYVKSNHSENDYEMVYDIPYVGSLPTEKRSGSPIVNYLSSSMNFIKTFSK
jgi:serine/threonine protein kinase